MDVPEINGLPKTLIKQGMNSVSVPASRKGLNLLDELQALWASFHIFRVLGQNLVHFVTIKPVIYRDIAAFLAAAPAVVSAISGFGAYLMGALGC